MSRKLVQRDLWHTCKIYRRNILFNYTENTFFNCIFIKPVGPVDTDASKYDLFFICVYLRRLPSVSVRLRTLFSMLSSLCGSSLRNFTASTSTLSTARIRACSAGNSPEGGRHNKQCEKMLEISMKLAGNSLQCI